MTVSIRYFTRLRHWNDFHNLWLWNRSFVTENTAPQSAQIYTFISIFRTGNYEISAESQPNRTSMAIFRSFWKRSCSRVAQQLLECMSYKTLCFNFIGNEILCPILLIIALEMFVSNAPAQSRLVFCNTSYQAILFYEIEHYTVSLLRTSTGVSNPRPAGRMRPAQGLGAAREGSGRSTTRTY